MTDVIDLAVRMTTPNQTTRSFSKIAELYEDGDSPVAWSLRREMWDVPVIAHLAIDGEPVSKARARFTSYGSPGRAYTPEKTRTAEESIAWHFRRARPSWCVDSANAYGVMAVFFCGTRQRRDVDNMVKLIMDACNKVVWQDDVQVYEISGRRAYTPGDARTEVAIYSLGPVDGLTKNCERCGNPFKVFNCTANSRKFCSRECAYNQRRDKSCIVCGNTFQTTVRIDQKYCSRECFNETRRAAITCSECGVAFTSQRCYVRERNYCSVKCRDASAHKRRTAAAKGTCAKCGGPTSKKSYTHCQGCKSSKTIYGAPRAINDRAIDGANHGV